MSPTPRELWKHLELLPPDIMKSFQGAVDEGRTTPEDFLHTAQSVLVLGVQYGLREEGTLAISTEIGRTLVSSRITWILWGFSPVLGGPYSPDSFTWRHQERLVTGYVSPMGATEAQQDVYQRFREDGNAPEAAWELARVLQPTVV